MEGAGPSHPPSTTTAPHPRSIVAPLFPLGTGAPPFLSSTAALSSLLSTSAPSSTPNTAHLPSLSKTDFSSSPAIAAPHPLQGTTVSQPFSAGAALNSTTDSAPPPSPKPIPVLSGNESAIESAPTSGAPSVDAANCAQSDPFNELSSREIDRNVHLLAIHNLGECYRRGLGTDINIRKACHAHKIAADQEYAPSMVRLGRIYAEGHGIGRDFEKAVHFFTKASKLNYPPARTAFSECLLYGRGVKKDTKTAVSILQSVADSDPAALVILGDCYYDGLGVAQDHKRALHFYRDAAKAKIAVAQTRIAKCLLYGHGCARDPSKAVQWYQNAADIGETSAFLPLALCFAKGTGTPSDLLKAFNLFQLAADENCDARAYHFIAECYHSGFGVERDIGEAFKHWTRASQEGVLKAKVALAECYLEGIACERDPSRAIALLEHETDPRARTLLGECFIDGVGVERDIGKGEFLLKEAAASGYSKASLILARHYFAGSSLSQSIPLALTYFKRAADGGCADAHVALAEIRLYGRGGESLQDVVEGVQWVEAGKELKSARAEALLAMCYKRGIGKPKNPDLAFSLLSNAGSRGDRLAKRELAACMLLGEGCEKDPVKATDLLGQLAEEGDGLSARYLGQLLLDGQLLDKNIQRAVDMFRKGDALGDAVSSFWLGWLYKKGSGVEVDSKKAAVLFERAASKGEILGTACLAYSCEEGLGVEKDVRRAVSLYESVVRKKGMGQPYLSRLLSCYTKVTDDMVVSEHEAAVLLKLMDQKETFVAHRLAWLYFQGTGVSKDPKKGVEMLEEVLKQGPSERVLVLLAKCLSSKDFGSEGVAKAVGYLKQGSQLGYARSQLELARFSFRGLGDAGDPKTGMLLLEQASQNGSTKASIILGDLYSKGYLTLGGVENVHSDIDWVKAVSYYKRSEASAYGSYRLAKCYLHGYGVPVDIHHGIQLLRRAARKESAHAQLLLARFFEHGVFNVPVDLQQARKLYEKSVHRVSGRTRGRAMFRYASFLEKHGCEVGVFETKDSSDDRVAELLKEARCAKCKEAGNDLAVLIVRKSGNDVDLVLTSPPPGGSTHGQPDTASNPETASGAPPADCERSGFANRAVEDVNGNGELSGEVNEEGDVHSQGLDSNYQGLDSGAEGCGESTGSAFRMFLEAESQGVTRARANAGICLEQGIGVMRDIDAAKRHYESGAKGGDTIAMNNLAILLLEDDWNAHVSRARELFSRASQAGSRVRLEAVVNLGKIFEGPPPAPSSKNSEPSREEKNIQGKAQAFHLYMQAANAGSIAGMFNVASSYEWGIGIERNDRLAIKYYEKALQGGMKLAEQRLSYLKPANERRRRR